MPPPNIVVLSAAPLRADHLSCYGYGRDTSPHLDTLAAEGALFERVYTTGAWTPPTFGSLLTGLYPSSHGVTVQSGLAETVRTLPQALAAAGYRTAGFSTSSLIGQLKQLDRGFHEFHEPWSSRRGDAGEPGDGPAGALARAWKTVRGSAVFSEAWRRSKHLSWRLGLSDKEGGRMTRRVVEWIEGEARRREPFFLLVHLQEMHHPYLAPRPHRYRYIVRGAPGVDWELLRRINVNPYLFITGKVSPGVAEFAALAALYDAEIRYTDELLGAILGALGGQGLLDRTVVAALSPHGENLGDHGLGEHQGCLYETLVRVPLILRYPEKVPAGLRVGGLAQITDVFPTLLDLAGVAEVAGVGAEGLALQGWSLLPFDRAAAGREAVYAEQEGYSLRQLDEIAGPGDQPFLDRFARSLRMIRAGDSKYIRASDGSEELYDLAADPGELDDLAPRQPERARAMAARLDSFLDTLQQRSGAAHPEQVERSVIEELRAMGYRI
jgi:arylsulfatase A-like enzyme